MSELKGKYIGLILAAILAVTLIPVSMTYAKSQDEKKVSKYVELADRAAERVENLIDLIISNATTNETIINAGLMPMLEGNITLFRTFGLGNLSDAHEALEDEEFDLAIANATQSISISKEVFKALNTILGDSGVVTEGVATGNLVDAQALIEAYERTLSKIERLREISDLPPAVHVILDNASAFLDVDTAIEGLSDGRVDETHWSLVQANKLLALAHSSLKKKAGELNVKRLGNYFKTIEKVYIRISRQINKTLERSQNEELSELNRTLVEDVKPLIVEAVDNFDPEHEQTVAAALPSIIEARNILEEIQRDLPKVKGGAP